jgi:hypothetical protein
MIGLPSVPTGRQAVEELSPFARKPEDEDIVGILPRPDHLRRLNPKHEIRHSPRGRQRPLRLRILVDEPPYHHPKRTVSGGTLSE